MSDRWQAALAAAPAHRPWPVAIGRPAILVPASLEALAVELQRAPESILLPLGGGTDGLAATQPDALYLLDGLLEPASVDETSATLDLPASMTWGAAQAIAVAYGLTLTDIPDAFADATIGGTLARQPWQPTLHHSATARARCIGLSAMLTTGARYQYKTASRTASGPSPAFPFFDDGAAFTGATRFLPFFRSGDSGDEGDGSGESASDIVGSATTATGFKKRGPPEPATVT